MENKKRTIVSKLLAKQSGKIEGKFKQSLKIHYFQYYTPKFCKLEEFLGQKYVIKPYRDILVKFPSKAPKIKNGLFLPLSRIFYSLLLNIWQAHPNRHYFSEEDMKRRIRPRSFTALSLDFGYLQLFLAKLVEKHP